MKKIGKMLLISGTMALIMSCIMSLLMSLCILGASGFNAIDLLKEWGIAFPLAFAFSMITAATIPPLYGKMFKKIAAAKAAKQVVMTSNPEATITPEISMT